MSRLPRCAARGGRSGFRPRRGKGAVGPGQPRSARVGSRGRVVRAWRGVAASPEAGTLGPRCPAARGGALAWLAGPGHALGLPHSARRGTPRLHLGPRLKTPSAATRWLLGGGGPRREGPVVAVLAQV